MYHRERVCCKNKTMVLYEVKYIDILRPSMINMRRRMSVVPTSGHIGQSLIYINFLFLNCGIFFLYPVL